MNDMTVGGAISSVEDDDEKCPAHHGVMLAVVPIGELADAQERWELHAHSSVRNQSCAKRHGAVYAPVAHLQSPRNYSVEGEHEQRIQLRN
jgi:hypothetical protein